jgi:hypothetical protein
MAEEKKVEEIKDERRNFLGPDDITLYYIAPPTAEDIRGADWEYSKMYTKSLIEGITTAAEMMDILRRRGIIGPEFEQRAAELADDLSKKALALDNAKTIEEKRDLAIEVAQAREELFQWNQRLNGPMNNTCEQIADDIRLEFLTSCMVQSEDNKRIWDSYDNFLKEKSQALAVRSRFEIMLFLQGLESDFLEQTPEATAMREVEADIMQKAEEAMKAVEALTQEAEEVAEEKAAPKKTAPKKRVTKPKAKAKTSTRGRKPAKPKDE